MSLRKSTVTSKSNPVKEYTYIYSILHCLIRRGFCDERLFSPTSVIKFKKKENLSHERGIHNLSRYL